MAAIKKTKRKRDRPFSALPRRNADKVNTTLASKLLQNSITEPMIRLVYGSPAGIYTINCRRTWQWDDVDITDLDTTYDWKILSFKEPFYRDYEEEFKREEKNTANSVTNTIGNIAKIRLAGKGSPRRGL